jgi:hypothetical protein
MKLDFKFSDIGVGFRDGLYKFGYQLLARH